MPTRSEIERLDAEIIALRQRVAALESRALPAAEERATKSPPVEASEGAVVRARCNDCGVEEDLVNLIGVASGGWACAIPGQCFERQEQANEVPASEAPKSAPASDPAPTCDPGCVRAGAPHAAPMDCLSADEIDEAPARIHQRRPAGYVWMFPELADLAESMGYALLVHGSLARDFDLVAVPWVESATDAATLAEAIRAKVGGAFNSEAPRTLPHGRMAWPIHLGKEPYIDLSVAALREADEKPWRCPTCPASIAYHRDPGGVWTCDGCGKCEEPPAPTGDVSISREDYEHGEEWLREMVRERTDLRATVARLEAFRDTVLAAMGLDDGDPTAEETGEWIDRLSKSEAEKRSDLAAVRDALIAAVDGDVEPGETLVDTVRGLAAKVATRDAEIAALTSRLEVATKAERERCRRALCFPCYQGVARRYVDGMGWRHHIDDRLEHCDADGLQRRDGACIRENCPVECEDGHEFKERLAAATAPSPGAAPTSERGT